MSDDEKYPIGTRLLFRGYGDGCYGTVIPNFKLPGDICVQWDNQYNTISSYCPDWLEEHCEIVPPETKA